MSTKMEKLEITNYIRTLRFFAGEMTQQELAERAGVSRQTIIAVEAGNGGIELVFAHALGQGHVFACHALCLS